MHKILNKIFLVHFGMMGAVVLLVGLGFSLSSFQLAQLMLAGLLVSLVFNRIFRRIFLKPILEMQTAARQVVEKELESKITEVNRDKIELQAILSSMVEGVIVIGQDEKILMMNAPIDRMFDLRTFDAVGKPYWEVIRHDTINSALKESLEEKKTLKKEISLISPTDSHFLMQISPVILSNGRLTGVVAVFHNITELKKLSQMRSEFVANVSHELKTPLTTIKGFVETLKDGAIHDRQKAERFLEIIKNHTDRLEHLVNDLLTLASIESREKPLKMEEVQIPCVIETILQLLKDQIEHQGLRCEVDIKANLPKIQGDAISLEQLFLNLLDNAIKYTPTGGLIKITSRPENGFIRTDVEDTGMGIEAESLPRIFERFYRVDKARSREMGGTGLGLAIVKHIVQIHGGHMNVVSQPGKGSTFSVYLPINS